MMSAFFCSYFLPVLCRNSVRVSLCRYCTGVDLLESTDAPNSDTRVVKVAIVGPPNAGKSTLINSLVGRRVCAISSKVHTTRRHSRAIAVEGNTQMIFLDTPGLISAEEMRKHKLDRSLMCDAELALLQADVIGVVHDVANQWTRDRLDSKSLRLLQLHQDKPSVLIMNKVDILKSKRRLLDLVKILTNDSLCSPERVHIRAKEPLSELSVKDIMKQDSAWPHFSKIFMVSALTGNGVGDVREYLLQQAVAKPWVFKESEFTDESMEEVTVKAVQAKLLEYLPQEIPYNLSVVMEYFNVSPTGDITAVVLVKCPAPRIEKVVVGTKGIRIRTIAREIEQELRNTFQEHVHLKLIVTGKSKKLAANIGT